MDRNEMILVGRIGSKIKSGKTVNGEPYIWLPVYLENRAGATSTENNFHQGLNIMCYKPNVIKYLEKVKAHQGNTVVIFGFVSSFRHTVKGKDMVLNAINATEIYVVKTKSDEEIVNKNNE